MRPPRASVFYATRLGVALFEFKMRHRDRLIASHAFFVMLHCNKNVIIFQYSYHIRTHGPRTNDADMKHIYIKKE